MSKLKKIKNKMYIIYVVVSCFVFKPRAPLGMAVIQK